MEKISDTSQFIKLPLHYVLRSQKDCFFFHSFTCCDVTSYFANQENKSAWKTWLAYPEVTDAFVELSSPCSVTIAEESMSKLERFIVLMYSRTSDDAHVNTARMNLFSRKSRSIEHIPPSQSVLEEYVKRASFQSGHVWGQSLELQPYSGCYPLGMGSQVNLSVTVQKWTTMPIAQKAWKQIYQTHQNKIEEYWNQEEKETYEREMERIEEQDREETNEDIPRLVLDPYKKVKVNRFEISEEEMKKVIEKLKTGKSAGLDGLRAELYKELIKDRRAIEKLTASYKKVLEEKQEPTDWKKSKTIMIPKNNRPTETELRPIAMTDVSYKILMSLIGREIENHVAENKIEKFEQAGFTKGGNILDNLFILRECVEETYIKKEQMVAIAIDFKKHMTQ